MTKILSYAALAAALAIAGPVLAQSTSSGAGEAAPQGAPPSSSAAQPPSSSASPSEAPSSAATPSGSNAAANAGASTEISSGMSVKDNTGATIGQVTAVKDSMATIKMGSDTFTVDTSKLGVQGGAATINATQAELKKMLPPKK